MFAKTLLANMVYFIPDNINFVILGMKSISTLNLSPAVKNISLN